MTLTGRGHYFRAVSYRGEGEIALYASILSALRHSARGSKGLRLRPEDLRAKLKVARASKLLIFCVDGSGSMAAEARMKETKGAIVSLLLSAYQKRDQVALMVFKEKKARLVLPPTSSVEFARRILERLSVGGSTPLPKALIELGNFLNLRRRLMPQEEIVVILVTDGRGNVSLYGRPLKEEIKHLAQALKARFPEVQFLVIDTETGPVKLEMARQLATWLGAHYFAPEALRADRLTEIAKQKIPFSFCGSCRARRDETGPHFKRDRSFYWRGTYSW